MRLISCSRLHSSEFKGKYGSGAVWSSPSGRRGTRTLRVSSSPGWKQLLLGLLPVSLGLWPPFRRDGRGAGHQHRRRQSSSFCSSRGLHRRGRRLLQRRKREQRWRWSAATPRATAAAAAATATATATSFLLSPISFPFSAFLSRGREPAAEGGAGGEQLGAEGADEGEQRSHDNSSWYSSLVYLIFFIYSNAACSEIVKVLLLEL